MASFNLKRFIKHPLKGLENAGRSAGQVAKTVAPFLPPGFREAAALGGSVAAGGNWKDDLMSLGTAEIGSYLGGRGVGQNVAGAYKTGGLTGVLKGAPRILGASLPGAHSGPVTSGSYNPNADPGLDDPWAFLDPTGTTSGGGGGGTGPGSRPTDNPLTAIRRRLGLPPITLGNVARGAAGQLGLSPSGNGGGLGNLALAGLAGVQAVNSAKASKRAGQMQDKAIATAEGRWASQAPIRAAAQRKLLAPVRPDLTNVYQNPENPFSRGRLPRATARLLLPAGTNLNG